MDRKISLTLLCVMLMGMSLVCCSQQQTGETQPNSEELSSNKVNKLATSKLRATRSLGDMMEKVKNKIFGSRKQSAATAQNINAQRWNPSEPMSVANSYPQPSQYNPYSPLSSYQWPTQNGQSFLQQQYNPNMFGASSFSPSGASMTSAQGLDSSQQSLAAANPSSGSGGGLFSAASHLIAQYMAPALGSSSQASSVSSQGASQTNQLNTLMANQQSNPMSQSGVGNVGQHQQSAAANSMIPTAQQNQYTDFATLLDNMVASSGVRNSPNINQYLSGPSGSSSSLSQSMQAPGQGGLVGPQSVPYQSNGQASSSMASSNSMLSGNVPLDHDMSSSNTVQTYMPGPGQQQQQQQQVQQQQASGQHKSPMVSLAENLAPGAQFNKLVSFPFSLTSNDDSSKDGKFKLHIPFMNQHVKRMSTDSTPSTSNGNMQRQQQQQQSSYNAYLNNHQQQANNNYNSNMLSSSGSQMSAQASQVSPVNVAPSSSSQLISSPSSPSSSLLQNSRPVWSTADLQTSSSKLTPISSVAAPSSSASSSALSSVSTSVSASSGSNPSST